MFGLWKSSSNALQRFSQQSSGLVHNSFKNTSIRSIAQSVSDGPPLIEVEIKFKWNSKIEEKFKKSFKFIEEKRFTDVYYDNQDYFLTCQDIWFRCRTGKFECKVPLQSERNVMDNYRELTTVDEIKEFLASKNLIGQNSKNFEDYVEEAGLFRFGTITTVRRKYQKDEFTLDLDSVDLKSKIYQIGEVELMVPELGVSSAMSKILDFCWEHELDTSPIRGKVLEYLLLNNPKHYEALEKCGLIARKMKRDGV